MDDKELLCMFKQEDTRSYAFNLIVRKYQERLYWHIRKIVVSHDDTDDVIQNTFLKVWKALDGFREDSQLFTWLYRIATNEALTFLKKKRNRLFNSRLRTGFYVAFFMLSPFWWDHTLFRIF